MAKNSIRGIRESQEHVHRFIPLLGAMRVYKCPVHNVFVSVRDVKLLERHPITIKASLSGTIYPACNMRDASASNLVKVFCSDESRL